MARESLGDDELVQALARNVAGAFPQLMANYHPQLYGFIVSQVKDHDLAEEITQEGWIRAYQALQRYSPEKIRSLNLRAWLFKVVQNGNVYPVRVKKQIK
jgi:RNA polymerase sigma-70 factor (ECF subfamily)